VTRFTAIRSRRAHPTQQSVRAGKKATRRRSARARQVRAVPSASTLPSRLALVLRSRPPPPAGSGSSNPTRAVSVAAHALHLEPVRVRRLPFLCPALPPMYTPIDRSGPRRGRPQRQRVWFRGGRGTPSCAAHMLAALAGLACALCLGGGAGCGDL
jgi:hypothetical protein